MLNCQRQNYHYSKLPVPGAIGYMSITPPKPQAAIEGVFLPKER